MGYGRRCIFAISSLLVLGSPPVEAQTYVKAFDSLTFSRPVWLGEIPGQADHFLVLEQVGRAQHVYRNNAAWAKSEFVKQTVTGGQSGGSEQGLLGFAFHPDYVHNRKYYIYYISGDNDVLDERTADSTLLRDSQAPARSILKIHDGESNHNGGTLGFGKDGYLYIGLGDGGGGGDEHEPPSAQNKDTLMGKFLRIDVDKPSGGKAYGIPSDNPFASGGGRPEIYAWGLRNPWKWSFDPLTDSLWVGDVGQNAVEEVSVIKKGGNYGWNQVEGNVCYTAGCKLSDFLPPIYAYTHSVGICVIGGVVYRGDPASPNYGSFIFGDHATGLIWALKRNGTATPLTKAPNGIELSSFNADSHQRVYFMGTGSGFIYRMSGSGWDNTMGALAPAKGLLRDKAGRTFTAAPGSRLARAAFGASGRVRILATDGSLAATLSQDAPALPAGLGRGVYHLDAGAGRADLLIVR